MRIRRLSLLVFSAFVVAACGPGRGLRLERASPPTDQLGAETRIGSIRVESATATWGQPGSLTSEGSTIWVSTPTPSGELHIQAIDSRTAGDGGVVSAPYRSGVPAAITSTPGVIWILVKPAQGHSQLLHFATRQEPARSVAGSAGLGAALRQVRRQALAFPRDTRLIGAAESRLWLVSRTLRGYVLWRYDTHASKLSRFPLASNGSPGVAITPQNVFVLLQTRPPGSVIVQTRDAAGQIIAASAPLRIAGTFQPAPLAACGDAIFGWSSESRGAALFRVDATVTAVRYTRTLPPLAHPSKLKAITFSDHCQNVWVATVGHSRGVVSQLRASSLEVTGQIDTSYVRALLWTHGSLWASDLEHDTVIRIR